MTVERQHLPTRRRAETVDLQFDGNVYQLTIGFYDDGRPGESFLGGAKAGSHMAAILNDASILTSLLLQNGVPASSFIKSLGRLGKDGEYCSVIGELVRLLAEYEKFDGGDSPPSLGPPVVPSALISLPSEA